MYVLDANVFIGAYRGYYAFDIVPSFWNTLVSLADNSKICSIDKIQQEIITPNDADPDELQEWTSENFRDYFERTDALDVLQNYAQIQQWAINDPQYTQAAKDEFARNADAWLIAYAKAKGYTLVTHEVYNPESKKRILIPVVCRNFQVKCINTFEMLKDLQVQF
ncbi:DUF4411 family protein [Bacillus sp. TL12]|uniref:DUF4411 family protein n=1 Tax=Bacillus sp. TL12 TaxID=2894756 RepID=UPI001F52AE07|nr:DUF4411 family protein [Bacillus sp. TL12]MCI0767268.1 DUF4411 family protein [Bacillus sp. TL12]